MIQGEAKHLIRQAALDLGFTTVGFASADPDISSLEFYRSWLAKGFHGEMSYLADHLALKADLSNLLPGVKTVIGVTLNYNPANELRQADGAPKIARYAQGRDYHKVLKGKFRRMDRWLREQYPDVRSKPCVDSAPVFERAYAHRAGLGWFGKNTMLIDSKRGSWFFLGLLLVTLEIEPDGPALGGCGSCRACIDACPTGAIAFEQDRWQVDSRSCISYLTIEHRNEFSKTQREAIDDWTFGCDVCQEVCPFNQPRETQPLRAMPTSEKDFSPRTWPTLVEIAKLSQRDWDRLTQGSPLRRTGFEGLRRNANANLKNRSRSES